MSLLQNLSKKTLLVGRKGSGKTMLLNSLSETHKDKIILPISFKTYIKAKHPLVNKMVPVLDELISNKWRKNGWTGDLNNDIAGKGDVILALDDVEFLFGLCDYRTTESVRLRSLELGLVDKIYKLIKSPPDNVKIVMASTSAQPYKPEYPSLLNRGILKHPVNDGVFDDVSVVEVPAWTKEQVKAYADKIGKYEWLKVWTITGGNAGQVIHAFKQITTN